VQGLNRLPMEYVFCRMEWLCQQEVSATPSLDAHGRRTSAGAESFMSTCVGCLHVLYTHFMGPLKRH
jgi:hypothetical protein